MGTNYFDYLLAYIVKSRHEAQVAESILKSAGIDCKLKQSSGTEALSIVRGNATLPYEQWGVYVSENNLEQSMQLLKSLDFHSSGTGNRHLKVIRPLVWFGTVLIFAVLALSFITMIKYIISQ